MQRGLSAIADSYLFCFSLGLSLLLLQVLITYIYIVSQKKRAALICDDNVVKS